MTAFFIPGIACGDDGRASELAYSDMSDMRTRVEFDMGMFDMGPHQPFVVWREADISTGGGCREILSWSAYSVLEFDQ